MLHIDIHTLGYLTIALVYIIFAFTFVQTWCIL